MGSLLKGAPSCSVPPSPALSSSIVPCGIPCMQPTPSWSQGPLFAGAFLRLLALCSCSSAFSPFALPSSETIMFLHQIFYQGLKARISSWPTLVLGECLSPPHSASFSLVGRAEPALFFLLLMQLNRRLFCYNWQQQGSLLMMLVHVGHGGKDWSKKPQRNPIPGPAMHWKGWAGPCTEGLVLEHHRSDQTLSWCYRGSLEPKLGLAQAAGGAVLGPQDALWSRSPTVPLLAADLFDILLPMLNIYQEFVRNHQYSLQILAHCKQNRDFDKLLKHYEAKPDCEERTLETFLTYPMFQVTRIGPSGATTAKPKEVLGLDLRGPVLLP